MLLLTAAHGVQEWAKLTEELEDQISSGDIQEFIGSSTYTETYVWARPEPGADAKRVTHWTEGSDPANRHQVAEWFSETIGEYGNYLVGEVLGSGNFSVVFACPWDDTKCIKIGHGGLSSIGDIYGDGWLEYALYCMKRTREGMNTPLLPDIHNLYVSSNEDWFVALIEKYDSTFDSDATDEIECKMRTVRSIISRGGYSLPNQPDKEYMAYANQLIADPLFPFCFDMHEGNFMYTKDGRVIVTDPSSDSSQPRCKIERMLRQIGVLMPDPIADAKVERREMLKKQDEIISRNKARMNLKDMCIPKLLVCSEGIARFDDLPSYATVAMEAMGNLIVNLGELPGRFEDRCGRGFGELLAIDPALPIYIRKVA